MSQNKIQSPADYHNNYKLKSKKFATSIAITFNWMQGNRFSRRVLYCACVITTFTPRTFLHSSHHHRRHERHAFPLLLFNWEKGEKFCNDDDDDLN